MAADFIAGCIGGCAGIVVGHPLDTVKVHLQTQDALNPQYRGTWNCFRSLLVKEGIRGLYKGMASPLLGVAGINAIVFGVYGNTQRYSSDPNSLVSHCMAGVLAGLVQTSICSPMELVKTRVQIAGDNLKPLECLKSIYKTEGVRGVFRGLGITAVREAPAFATYFVTYEYLTRSEDNTRTSTATMLMAGGLAGCASWAIVYPVDVVKSRLQIDGMNGAPKYKSAWDCCRKSIASEGYAFLTRGLTPTLIRAFPTNAACFTAVTWSMRIFNGEISFGIGENTAAVA
uniref:Mitochondrial basic amino acids transporter n=1 Tax=Photinus pyralis TaxID=7054 RepID=A0A1Y1KAE3_PHOPY